MKFPSEGMEVKLLKLESMANGEVKLIFAVHKDDARNTQHLLGSVGHPFIMGLARINYEATEDFVPLTSADLTQEARNTGVLDTRSGSLNETQGPPTRISETERTPAPINTPAPGNLSKRAAIWCQKPEVQLFMHKEYCIPRNFESAKGKIKELLEIQSLKEIIEGSDAAADYLALELKFKMWMNDPKYVPAGV